MARLFRIPCRTELWSDQLRENLSDGQAWLAESDAMLEQALRAQGVDLVGPEQLGPEVSVLVPMHPLEELVLLTQRLLGPGGCPWDQQQTHSSLKRYLLEEAYEVIDAIDAQAPNALCEELGDLILQPILHAEKAETFDSAEVGRGIVDKLIRRHPHVFGEVQADDADTVLRNWDAIKRQERGEEPRSVLAGVPSGMASLLRAYEISKRAARCGFEWPNLEAVWEKVREEERELLEAEGADAREAELGDLLFSVVNVARWMGIEPEEALRKMLNRFTRRFQTMEQLAEGRLEELTPEAWDELWNEAKRLVAAG